MLKAGNKDFVKKYLQLFKQITSKKPQLELKTKANCNYISIKINENSFICFACIKKLFYFNEALSKKA